MTNYLKLLGPADIQELSNVIEQSISKNIRQTQLPSRRNLKQEKKLDESFEDDMPNFGEDQRKSSFKKFEHHSRIRFGISEIDTNIPLKTFILKMSSRKELFKNKLQKNISVYMEDFKVRKSQQSAEQIKAAMKGQFVRKKSQRPVTAQQVVNQSKKRALSACASQLRPQSVADQATTINIQQERTLFEQKFRPISGHQSVVTSPMNSISEIKSFKPLRKRKTSAQVEAKRLVNECVLIQEQNQKQIKKFTKQVGRFRLLHSKVDRQLKSNQGLIPTVYDDPHLLRILQHMNS